jgi:MFS family permease
MLTSVALLLHDLTGIGSAPQLECSVARDKLLMAIGETIWSRRSTMAWFTFPLGVKVLIGTATLVSIARTMSLPFLAIHLSQNVGLDAGTVGLIIGTGAVIATFGGLFGGFVSDNLGRRGLFVGALVLSATGFTLMSFIKTPFAYFLLNAIVALANSFYEPLSRALLGDHVPHYLRRQAFSYRYMANNVGWAIGPIVGAFMGVAGGASGFLFTGIVLFAIAALLAVLLPAGSLSQDESSGLETEPFSFHRAMRFITFDPRMRWLLIGSLVAITSYGQMSITFSQYIAANFADGLVVFAKVVVVNPITIILLQPILSPLLGRIPAYYSLYLGCLLVALSNVIFLLAPSTIWLGVGMFVFTIGEMAIVPAEYDLVNRFSSPQYRGTYFGMHSLGEFGNFLGPWLGGMILSQVGGAGMFTFFAIAAVGAIPFYALTWISERRRVSSPS